MKIIGITGGIGSGKTTVAEIFLIMGFPVYNSDQRGKEVYLFPEVKKQVEAVLGKEAYHNEFTLNKKFITGIIFSDTKLLQKINSIIHPAVMQDFNEWCEFHRDKIFVLKESALLFETGIYKNCDKNILVTAPEEVRIQRVMKRDSLSKEEVQKRINNQLSDEKKIPLADFIIFNSGKELLTPQVENICKFICGG